MKRSTRDWFSVGLIIAVTLALAVLVSASMFWPWRYR